MKYEKMLDVSEDESKMYFCFFARSGNKIIALPKVSSTDTDTYAGESFDKLQKINIEDAKLILTNLMRTALVNHPKVTFCQVDAIKLLTNS